VLEQDIDAFNEEFKRTTFIHYKFEDILGKSDTIQKAKELARYCAKSDSTVLILGESGSGKELFTHAIHSASNRRKNPFISINCAAIPNELIFFTFGRKIAFCLI